MTTITSVTRKNSPWRYWYTLRKHVWLAIKPLPFAGLALALWYLLFWRTDLAPFAREATAWFPQLSGALIIGFLVFFGSMAYGGIDRRKQVLIRALFEKDDQTFLMYRDERTSNVTIVFLLLLTLALAFHAIASGYESLGEGVYSVFICSYFPSMFVLIIMYLDDVVGSSRWMQERVSEDLMSADIDKHFKFAQYGEPPKDPD